MSCATITDLANAIWGDLGSPTDLSVSAIQSKLTSDAFLGQLNLLMNGCHTVVSGEIVPALDVQEQAIYSLMYQAGFYARKLALLAAGTILPWTSLGEGDSRIVRVSSVDLMRLYRDMQKQLTDELNRLAAAYVTNGLEPKDIKYYGFAPDAGAFGYDMGYTQIGN